MSGYRWLRLGEVLRPGDEYRTGPAPHKPYYKWHKTGGAGWAITAARIHLHYRRKLESGEKALSELKSL